MNHEKIYAIYDYDTWIGDYLSSDAAKLLGAVRTTITEAAGMRALPIIFKTDMVRAILDGRKTVTRRVVKPQFEISLEGTECECRHEKGFWDMGGNEWACRRCGYGVIPIKGGSWIHAPYQLDDILYVRETWGEGYEDGTYIYKADDKLAELSLFRQSSKLIWRPSIHMPKAAARIWLKVTDVRVERLQDITEEQAIKEGFKGIPCECGGVACACTDCYNTGWIEPPCVDFVGTWNSHIKKSDLALYGWNANPWVWVIEFERCEKPKEEQE